MEFLVIAVAVAINILFIKFKLGRHRYADAMLDAILLIILSLLFKGSFGGLVTATYASAIVSLALWFFPPDIEGFFKGALSDTDEITSVTDIIAGRKMGL